MPENNSVRLVGVPRTFKSVVQIGALSVARNFWTKTKTIFNLL
jgi:hypothetical protein